MQDPAKLWSAVAAATALRASIQSGSEAAALQSFAGSCMNDELRSELLFLKEMGFTHLSVRKTQSTTQTAALPPDDTQTEWADLESRALVCTRCRLAAGRTQVVFGSGNRKASLMFIGEAPGRDEDLAGVPFVGRAGQLLTDIIKAMKLEREDVYIAMSTLWSSSQSPSASIRS